MFDVFCCFKVSLVSRNDLRTFRETTFPLNNGTLITRLGIQVSLVSLLLCDLLLL